MRDQPRNRPGAALGQVRAGSLGRGASLSAAGRRAWRPLRVAAKRGHDVVLFERTERIGGQLNLWAALPGREIFATTPDWYVRQLDKLGVDVRFGSPADADTVLAEKPDAILVATGSTYVRTGETGHLKAPIPAGGIRTSSTPRSRSLRSEAALVDGWSS